MICWVEKECVKPNKCDENCVMFKCLTNAINKSNLPEAYRHGAVLKGVKVDIVQYRRLNEIKTNIIEFVTSGKNLVIYSASCGNGKTSWASKLLIEYICSINDGNYMDTRALFINVIDLLMEVRMNREYGTDKTMVKNIMEKIGQADVVVWDEVGVTKLTDYEVMFLYSLINKRIDNKQCNIYTSNATLESAEINLTDRLFSRIYNLSEKLEFVGGDWRGDN